MNTVRPAFLYIGQHEMGCTSRMRADMLCALLPGFSFQVIDTLVPFAQTPRLMRSAGFRFKAGPLISATNEYILSQCKGEHYECIWVDKGVFITPETMRVLRKRTRLLVHYTPDAAFYSNRSRHFERSMALYDYLIVTKTFEKDLYLARVSKEKVLFATQGFDKKIHYPRVAFSEKKPCAAFIGLYEPSRGALISVLLAHQIPVLLGGVGWRPFLNKYRDSGLTFLGERVMQDDYARHLSSAYFGLGCLSKRFPELHTTRTFEIPACGTALITERNEEISSFFGDNEVIFYDDVPSLCSRLLYLISHPSELQLVTENGTRRVHDAGFDYESILKKVLIDVHLYP